MQLREALLPSDAGQADAGIGLTSIVDAAPVGVLVLAADGHIVYVNTALARMFGYGRAQMLGLAPEQLLPPRLRDNHAQFRRGFFENPQPRAMGDGRALFAQHAEGHEFPIEIGLSTVRHEGAPCAVAFVSEITRRHSLERRFTKVVTTLSIGLLVIDAAGRIVMANPALHGLFGYEPAALLGQNVEILLPVRLHAIHPAQRGAFFAAPSVRSMGSGRDLMAVHRDGREFPVEIGLTPIETEEGPQVLAAVTDISLRKKFETTLMQANAQLEEFTYIASHDLRSPLRGIADLLGWIHDDLDPAQLSESVRNNFARAQLRVERAEHMIDDLLEYARAGQRAEILSEVAPAELVAEALELLEIPPGFRVELDLTAGAFKAARTPLALALRNLLSNAFKHHGGATGLVRVSLAEEGRFVVLSVEDDGAGVAPGAEERIFKLFQRATTATPGHGVGLAVTRRMVNGSGGSITVERSALGGACFRIHWPRFQLKDIA